MSTTIQPPRHTRRAAAVLAVALAGVITGCGSSDNISNTSANRGSAQTTSTANNRPAQTAGAKLKLSADDNGALAFKQKQLSAKSGTVTLLMDDPNTTGEQHGIAVEGSGVDKDGPSVGPGQTSTVTVTLKPGKYTFYCPVPGHKAAGMTGILTIT